MNAKQATAIAIAARSNISGGSCAVTPTGRWADCTLSATRALVVAASRRLMFQPASVFCACYPGLAWQVPCTESRATRLMAA